MPPLFDTLMSVAYLLANRLLTRQRRTNRAEISVESLCVSWTYHGQGPDDGNGQHIWNWQYKGRALETPTQNLEGIFTTRIEPLNMYKNIKSLICNLN